MIRRRAENLKSSTAFQDLLFLLLCGVTILWVLSFLLINPVAKQHDIETPAEIMITMDWADHSNDDIDLWLRQPNGDIVYFGKKNVGIAHLERDDLGLLNDCTLTQFEEKCVRINREVIMLRGLLEGEYQLKFVVYTSSVPRIDGNPVKVEIIDINPYGVKFSKKFTYQTAKQQVSITRFTVDADGNISEFSDVPSKFDINRSSGTEAEQALSGGTPGAAQ